MHILSEVTLLFIANRSERVQQGDLRVRNWYERIGYWIALNGYASFRNMVSSFGPPGQDLAARIGGYGACCL